ncbi:F-box protein CPR30-like [Durio zibethinus]|uniref:F-box protein CPR30-like n=1 Tax=Durio zibethinus TaxID=66656 RepID=A0A6P5ZW45_DURZI|nr:F-box protein CPR30-like [Durio zibethinus]
MEKHVPSDLINDILSRLLVKSLLRFKCVSRGWCFLINDQNFIKRHLKRSTQSNSHSSLVIVKYTKLSLVDLSSLLVVEEVVDNSLKQLFRDSIKVLGICDGLHCLSNSAYNRIILWNMSTREHLTLPPVPENFLLHRTPKTVKFGVYASGALHWFVSRSSKEIMEDSDVFIVAINLNTHKQRFIRCPDQDQHQHQEYKAWNIPPHPFVFNTLGVFGEQLCAMDINGSRYSTVDIWLMKKYGVQESWTRLFSIPYFHTGYICRYGDPFVHPLTYSKNGDEVLVDVAHDHTRLMFYYNPKTESVRYVNVPACQNSSFEVQICHENLVSLTSRDRPQEEAMNTDRKLVSHAADYFPCGLGVNYLNFFSSFFVS